MHPWWWASRRNGSLPAAAAELRRSPLLFSLENPARFEYIYSFFFLPRRRIGAVLDKQNTGLVKAFCVDVMGHRMHAAGRGRLGGGPARVARRADMASRVQRLPLRSDETAPRPRTLFQDKAFRRCVATRRECSADQ